MSTKISLSPVNQLAKHLLIGFSLLIPWWFLPFSSDIFYFQKQTLFFLVTILLSVSWLIYIWKNKQVIISNSQVVWLSFLLIIPFLISSALSTNTPFQLMGRSSLMLGFGLFVIWSTTLAPNFKWKTFLNTLLLSGSLASLVTWWQLTPWPVSQIISNYIDIELPNTIIFTPTGSLLGLGQLLLPIGLAGWLETLINQKKHRQFSWWLNFIASVFITATVILTSIIVWKNSEVDFQLLPFNQGWTIAVENFKKPLTFLFGVGPQSFQNAFHLSRSVDFNQSNYWNISFANSSNEFLQLLTTIGLLGIISWLAWWLKIIITTWKNKLPSSMLVWITTMLVFFLILPYTTLSYVLLALFAVTLHNHLRDKNQADDLVLSLSAQTRQSSASKNSSAIFLGLITLLILILIGSFTYGWGRVYAAELAYLKSLQFYISNDGQNAYTKQQQAIRLNPFNPQYRIAYANTNLAIAKNLSQQSNLDAQQQQLVSVLVQQALREARNATALNPQSTKNWENLSNVYQQLGQVEGANQWALASLAQAIQTDPISPILRLRLAALYTLQDQPVQAQRLIEQAIQLKPDWATAYYNYGLILEQQEEYLLAYQAYQQANQLWSDKPSDTQNREQTQSKLQQLEPTVTEIINQQTSAANPTNLEEITAPNEPQVPTDQPTVTNPPAGFENLINDPSLESSQSGQTNIVLPEDVGF